MEWLHTLFSHDHATVAAACTGSYFAGLATDWAIHGGLLLFGGAGWLKAWFARRHHQDAHPVCEAQAEQAVRGEVAHG